MGRKAPIGALAVAAFVSGCSAKPSAAAAPRAPTGLARFLPLEDGTVFSYETSSEPGDEHGVLVLEVRRPRPDAAELVVAGRARRFTVTADAIAHAAGGFLLRAPLVVGAEWHGDFGHVHVSRVDASITVAAGTFGGCVETVEELTTREGAKRTTTAFCPGVGIALRETQVEQDGEEQSERIALKSFGKRFDARALEHELAPGPN